jgi:3'-5' exoribonuclease
MRRFFLRSAAAGDQIDDVYVITGKQIAVTTSGKYYIKCFVGDKSCQCTARMWNATREIFAQFPEAGFMHIRGRVENYQNNNQVIIEAWGPAREGAFHIQDLMPHTTKDVGKLFIRVRELCESLQNRHLAAVVHAFLDDEELMKNFCRAPAAMSFHHAFIGGLLEHTCNAMEAADAMARFYPKLNRDLVVAGIFLHDLAKTWELKYENCFGYTDGGQLVGHVVKIAMWIEEKAKVAAQELGEEIPRPLIDVLQHIVLSHHGEPEFGAAKVPATPEAIAVHVIENMDAKLTMALGATRDEEAPGEGSWTEYLKAFNVRMYKPDVAPADIDEPDPTALPEPAATAAATSPKLNNPLFGDFTKK